ncbi:MAG TPA: phosphoribosylglycinamide formyltransferase [Lamprocystis sp. (in: g-proteobacteria)]|nr:phosphoribosylglycinamide formyltransferase [Lamprocystis sp. (in: g-proteobacteria)]
MSEGAGIAEDATLRPGLAVVVLISGGGSNLQALIEAQSHWPYRIVAVVSNEAAAGGLALARRADIPTEILSHRGFADRSAYDQALAAIIDRHAPGLVVLAGFMRILTPALVARYAGRMLNIHPSLLPKFRGLNTHRQALEAGAADHGASVHFVTAELDGGPVIAQTRVPILPGDDPPTLAARVLVQEHRLLPRVVGWFAQGRLQLTPDGQVRLDGAILSAPWRLEPGDSAAT